LSTGVTAGNFFTFICRVLAQNFQSELQLAWQGQLSDFVTGLVYTPNGNGWAAVSAAGEVVWNAGLDRLVELQAADGYSIDGVAFSVDSCWLAASGQSGRLLIWDCRGLNFPPNLVHKITVNKWIDHLVWHPTKPYLAISYGSQVGVWNIATSTEIITREFDKSSIFDLAWHPTGEYLTVAGSRGVKIWSFRNSEIVNQLVRVDSASLKIAWSSDGRYLAVGNLDRTLTIMDFQNPNDPWTLQGCPGKIRQIVWLEGTATPCLAVASGTAILLWHLNPDATTWNGQLLEGHQDTVETLAAHPRESVLASGGTDGYVCIWSSAGAVEQVLNHIGSQFTILRWHPYDPYLATGSQAGSIGLWVIPA
jgi:WD40 repeat protein